MSTSSASKTKENYILQYVEAAVASSSRARAVVIVMITASVLAIIPTWNAGGMWKEGEGWMDSRINIRNAALPLFDLPCGPYLPEPSKDEKEIDRRAQEFLGVAKLDRCMSDHKQILVEEIKDLKTIKGEQMSIIRAPFFGVAFDANDLGMFAGITLSIVLVWLRFSLTRELRNLKLAFNEAEKRGGESLQLCYNLLAMHQVLSVPPMRGSRFRWFWVSIALFLYLVPALAYGYLFKSDRQSEHIGNILSPYNTELQWKVGAGLLSLIIVLTIVCFLNHLKIDMEWKLAHGKTLELQNVERNNLPELKPEKLRDDQPEAEPKAARELTDLPSRKSKKRRRK